MNCAHQLELDIRDNPEALRRIITVCRRRDCRIVALNYEAGRVRLRVDGEPQQAAQLRSWLGNLVDVLAVRPFHSASGPTSPTARARLSASRASS